MQESLQVMSNNILEDVLDNAPASSCILRRSPTVRYDYLGIHVRYVARSVDDYG